MSTELALILMLGACVVFLDMSNRELKIAGLIILAYLALKLSGDILSAISDIIFADHF
jgi:hypothetical protein